jgi:hypothetical protein
MLVRPVLCCGGGGRLEGGSPSLHLALQLPATGGHGPAAGGRAAQLSAAAAGDPDARHRALADMTLKPVTLWLSLPLLQRLEACADALFPSTAGGASGAANSAVPDDSADAGGVGPVSDPPLLQQQQAAKRRSAAQKAIDSILLDMQVRYSWTDASAVMRPAA